MIKKLFQLIKKIVISGFLLYGYNILTTPLNIMIPINLITVSAMTILGFPALFAFILIHIIVF